MRFNPVSNIDFTKWSQVKMERENNIKEFRNAAEEKPKYLRLNILWKYNF